MSQLKALVDKLLTDASSMFIPEGYISEQLFPYIGVVQKTGKLGKYSNSHIRIESNYIGGGGAYRRVEPITRSTTTYQIDGHGLEGLVTKDDYRNVELPFDAENDEVIGLSTQLWVEKEKVLADALSDTAVITQNTTKSGTGQYSDYNNSDPMTDFSTARTTVRAGCGMAPNAAWMDWYTANYLRFHPQLLDAQGFKYTLPGGLSDDSLAKALNVKKLLIADVTYNSANEGAADSLASAWGKHIWFGVLPDKAAVRQVSVGYRLGFKGDMPRKVYKQTNFNPPESTTILVEDEYEFLISNAAACYVIKSAVA